MSSTKDLLRIYSKYNVWAYRRLLVAVEQLSDQAYHSNTGLAFRSIHGTLNHLYLGDQLWIKRFKNDTNGIASISSFWTEAEVYSKPGDAECYWEKYITDRKVLAASILTQVGVQSCPGRSSGRAISWTIMGARLGGLALRQAATGTDACAAHGADTGQGVRRVHCRS
ncbi:uncharacterized protein BJ171DRAFT_127278 [Polychytrium aggregatum]|uniref:uncharacterized protein n=1 Tax=Polychytrium aggregatum TaxID=110093 RepID=UPI0022FE3A7B|nr:uncharacterized protein BJ171DRAFT_127278 [Polychytrium aggregatum]KAI9204002.1 hypothetical protein BJ171DRAFT_127278 [Polychytrium aggregatum]